MKKIMFSDKYGLTDAVLARRKTMTRRIIPPIEIDWNRRGKVTLPISGYKHGALWMDCRQFLHDSSPFDYVVPQKYQPHYSVGEEVAIAQSYRNIIAAITPSFGSPHTYDDLRDKPGWNNKMFVRADLMPHRIRITNIKAERLQDISDEDCKKEGIIHVEWKQWLEQDLDDLSPQQYKMHDLWTLPMFEEELLDAFADQSRDNITATDPHTCFTVLFAKLAKMQPTDMMQLNPWVFAYEFELVV